MHHVIDKLPLDQRTVLTTLISALRNVSNVVALVLGGSHATGLAREGSDIDVGIYYREAAPLPIEEIRAVAESISAPGAVPVVTDLYGWGPWVNGGAWIQTSATRIDLLYRNVDQVRRVLEEGRQGVWRHDYDQQPPHGFRSIIYFGETRCCIPLYDPDGVTGELKALAADYPELLRSRIIQDCLWSAEFSMWSCTGFAASADVVNAVSCLTRTAHYLVHAIFAINKEYFLNDKHTARILSRLPLSPQHCVERLNALLAQPGREKDELEASLAGFHQIWAEVVALSDGVYQPRFSLTAAKSV